MEEIEVPQYFLCPISLEMMKDPVTLPTGITYDRENIEKWVYSDKNTTCPVTKQPITDCDLTPNHNLRRLIQSWCILHASLGIQRIPTPKPPITKSQVSKLLTDSQKPQQLATSLQKLRSIANNNVSNKKCIEAAGAVDFLASLVVNSFKEESSDGHNGYNPCEDALSILYTLQLSEQSLRKLAAGSFVESLPRIMRHGGYECRVYALLIMKPILEVADPTKMTSLKKEVFVETVSILRDQISQQASKAALQVLIHMSRRGGNRVKTVEANAVPVLVQLLLESSERRVLEMALVLLELLCQCAQGRADLVGHGAGLAVVSKKILRVSHVASESAVRILYLVSRFSAASEGVLEEMLQVGVVAKLCLVLQVQCGNRTKEKAREVLRLHAKAWKGSPCIPANLVSSYPS